MAKIKIHQAIESLNPNAFFAYSHDPEDDRIELIETIDWQQNTTPIAKEDILAEQARLQAIEDA